MDDQKEEAMQIDEPYEKDKVVNVMEATGENNNIDNKKEENRNENDKTIHEDKLKPMEIENQNEGQKGPSENSISMSRNSKYIQLQNLLSTLKRKLKK